MEAKAFTEAKGNQVAFIAQDINEVIKAHECGLVVWDEAAWESGSSGFNEHYESDDAEEPILDSLAEVVTTANTMFAHGVKIYCGSWLEGFKTTPNGGTNIRSEFHIGQFVYTVRDNKIKQCKIRGLRLFKDDFRHGDAERIPSDRLTDTAAIQLRHKGSGGGMYEKDYDYYGEMELIPLKELFPTKEALADHLFVNVP